MPDSFMACGKKREVLDKSFSGKYGEISCETYSILFLAITLHPVIQIQDAKIQNNLEFIKFFSSFNPCFSKKR